MDAEERYQQKRLGYIKFSLNEIHKLLLGKITLDRAMKHVSNLGEKVIKHAPTARVSQVHQVPGH